MPFDLALGTTILVLVFAFLWWRRKREQEDPYAIDPCPNPDCVRCRRYNEVNDEALRKLSWILKELNDKSVIERVTEGVRKGRRQHGFQWRSRKPGVSPTSGQYPTVLLIPRLETSPVVTSMHKGACGVMEANVNCVLKEFLEAQNRHDGNWIENDVQLGSSPWNVLHLMNQGIWIDENLKLFSETVKLIRAMEIMDGCIFGNAFFSVVEQGTTIEPHCGPTNARHRLHLTLQTPPRTTKEPALTVREEKVHWREREAFVFDDSLTHAVEYPEGRTPEKPRIVLIVDLWHPSLSEWERRAIKDLYPA